MPYFQVLKGFLHYFFICVLLNSYIHTVPSIWNTSCPISLPIPVGSQYTSDCCCC